MPRPDAKRGRKPTPDELRSRRASSRTRERSTSRQRDRRRTRSRTAAAKPHATARPTIATSPVSVATTASTAASSPADSASSPPFQLTVVTALAETSPSLASFDQDEPTAVSSARGFEDQPVSTTEVHARGRSGSGRGAASLLQRPEYSTLESGRASQRQNRSPSAGSALTPASVSRRPARVHRPGASYETIAEHSTQPPTPSPRPPGARAQPQIPAPIWRQPSSASGRRGGRSDPSPRAGRARYRAAGQASRFPSSSPRERSVTRYRTAEVVYTQATNRGLVPHRPASHDETADAASPPRPVDASSSTDQSSSAARGTSGSSSTERSPVQASTSGSSSPRTQSVGSPSESVTEPAPGQRVDTSEESPQRSPVTDTSRASPSGVSTGGQRVRTRRRKAPRGLRVNTQARRMSPAQQRRVPSSPQGYTRIPKVQMSPKGQRPSRFQEFPSSVEIETPTGPTAPAGIDTDSAVSDTPPISASATKRPQRRRPVPRSQQLAASVTPGSPFDLDSPRSNTSPRATSAASGAFKQAVSFVSSASPSGTPMSCSISDMPSTPVDTPGPDAPRRAALLQTLNQATPDSGSIQAVERASRNARMVSTHISGEQLGPGELSSPAHLAATRLLSPVSDRQSAGSGRPSRSQLAGTPISPLQSLSDSARTASDRPQSSSRGRSIEFSSEQGADLTVAPVHPLTPTEDNEVATGHGAASSQQPIRNQPSYVQAAFQPGSPFGSSITPHEAGSDSAGGSTMSLDSIYPSVRGSESTPLPSPVPAPARVSDDTHTVLRIQVQQSHPTSRHSTHSTMQSIHLDRSPTVGSFGSAEGLSRGAASDEHGSESDVYFGEPLGNIHPLDAQFSADTSTPGIGGNIGLSLSRAGSRGIDQTGTPEQGDLPYEGTFPTLGVGDQRVRQHSIARTDTQDTNEHDLEVREVLAKSTRMSPAQVVQRARFESDQTGKSAHTSGSSETTTTTTTHPTTSGETERSKRSTESSSDKDPAAGHVLRVAATQASAVRPKAIDRPRPGLSALRGPATPLRVENRSISPRAQRGIVKRGSGGRRSASLSSADSPKRSPGLRKTQRGGGRRLPPRGNFASSSEKTSKSTSSSSGARSSAYASSRSTDRSHPTTSSGTSSSRPSQDGSSGSGVSMSVLEVKPITSRNLHSRRRSRDVLSTVVDSEEDAAKSMASVMPYALAVNTKVLQQPTDPVVAATVVPQTIPEMSPPNLRLGLRPVSPTKPQSSSSTEPAAVTTKPSPVASVESQTSHKDAEQLESEGSSSAEEPSALLAEEYPSIVQPVTASIALTAYRPDDTEAMTDNAPSSATTDTDTSSTQLPHVATDISDSRDDMSPSAADAALLRRDSSVSSGSSKARKQSLGVLGTVTIMVSPSKRQLSSHDTDGDRQGTESATAPRLSGTQVPPGGQCTRTVLAASNSAHSLSSDAKRAAQPPIVPRHSKRKPASSRLAPPAVSASISRLTEPESPVGAQSVGGIPRYRPHLVRSTSQDSVGAVHSGSDHDDDFHGPLLLQGDAAISGGQSSSSSARGASIEDPEISTVVPASPSMTHSTLRRTPSMASLLGQTYVFDNQPLDSPMRRDKSMASLALHAGALHSSPSAHVIGSPRAGSIDSERTDLSITAPRRLRHSKSGMLVLEHRRQVVRSELRNIQPSIPRPSPSASASVASSTGLPQLPQTRVSLESILSPRHARRSSNWTRTSTGSIASTLDQSRRSVAQDTPVKGWGEESWASVTSAGAEAGRVVSAEGRSYSAADSIEDTMAELRLTPAGGTPSREARASGAAAEVAEEILPPTDSPSRRPRLHIQVASPRSVRREGAPDSFHTDESANDQTHADNSGAAQVAGLEPLGLRSPFLTKLKMQVDSPGGSQRGSPMGRTLTPRAVQSLASALTSPVSARTPPGYHGSHSSQSSRWQQASHLAPSSSSTPTSDNRMMPVGTTDTATASMESPRDQPRRMQPRLRLSKSVSSVESDIDDNLGPSRMPSASPPAGYHSGSTARMQAFQVQEEETIRRDDDAVGATSLQLDVDETEDVRQFLASAVSKPSLH